MDNQCLLVPRKIGLFYNEQVISHKCEEYDHPECPNRVTNILAILQLTKLMDYLKVYNDNTYTADYHDLTKIHTEDYVNELYNLNTEDGRFIFMNKYSDIYCNQYTLSAIQHSVGLSLLAVDMLRQGQINHGIILTRPPGHHAYRDSAGGFCFVNNVALAVHRLLTNTNNDQKSNKFTKVAIFDWDVHHGDGTQQIMQEMPNLIAGLTTDNLLFITVQKYNDGAYYPGTGSTLNSKNIYSIPFNGNIGGSEYLDIFNNQVLPKFEQFKPDVICISAGFDTARGDKLGNCSLDEEDYVYMTSKLKRLAPLLIFLEGGYNVTAIAHAIKGMTINLLNDLCFKTT